MRILSGIKPSGLLHVGNYVGMIRPMVESQKRGELLCFIADMHSLTTLFDGTALRDNTTNALVDLIALGIDPLHSVLWVQSDVPEVAELSWYLSNVTPMGLLERCHAYKDAIARNVPANHGIFAYPVLMAADILLYQSNVVPVGKDQKQHVEVTRDIAIRFNQIYGETFVIPLPEIASEVALIPGTDGQKMSKSYGNIIEIFGEEKSFKKKIMGIITDSLPVEAPKDPETSTIFQLYTLFAPSADTSAFSDRLRAGGMGYGDAKKELFALVWEYLAPFRAKRAQLVQNQDYITEIRRHGADKARAMATKTIDLVRSRLGMGR